MMKDTLRVKNSTLDLCGPTLNNALKVAGVTKYRLAKDLGLSYRIVQYWSEGSHHPSLANVEKVREYLGMERPKSIEARLSALETSLRVLTDANTARRITDLNRRVKQSGEYQGPERRKS